MSKKPALSNALRDRILKNSTIKDTSILTTSKFFQPKDYINCGVPMIDTALSGEVDGGLTAGILMIAGPSKHFKTGFALLMATTFLKKHPDGIILFYDSEFGSPLSYFESYGIPSDSVVHTPIQNVEQAKHDMMNQLENLTDQDKVLIMVDSIGNLASKKEVEDALEGKSVADMTRAKALKSLFRMITPHLTMKNIPFVAINHSYKTIEMYSKDVVGGGTGAYYSADDIWIVGRQQEKDGKELQGFNFIINIEKSRTVKEKSKIPITITFEDGIHRWSGLFDLAVEFGILYSEKQGWYKLKGAPDSASAFRRGDVENDGDFWRDIFSTTDMKKQIKNKYKLQTDRVMLEDTPKEKEEA